MNQGTLSTLLPPNAPPPCTVPSEFPHYNQFQHAFPLCLIKHFFRAVDHNSSQLHAGGLQNKRSRHSHIDTQIIQRLLVLPHKHIHFLSVAISHPSGPLLPCKNHIIRNLLHVAHVNHDVGQGGHDFSIVTPVLSLACKSEFYSLAQPVGNRTNLDRPDLPQKLARSEFDRQFGRRKRGRERRVRLGRGRRVKGGSVHDLVLDEKSE